MTTTLTTFDGGTPGNNLVAGQNGVVSIVNGTPKFDTGFHGAASAHAGNPTNTVDTRFRVDLGMTGDHSGSIYLKNPTAHGSTSSSVNFWTLVTSSAEFVVQMRVRPDNALSIRTTGAVEVRTGTAGEVPVGSWIRLDWQQSGTTFNWRLFTTNPEGTTPDLSGTLTTTATGLPNGLYLGGDSAAAIIKDWQFDTVRADSTGAWFGPYSTGSSLPILRRNLASDPAATVNASVAGKLTWAPRFYGSGATGTTTLQTGTGPVADVTTFMRKTWGSTIDTSDVGFLHAADANPYPVTPGETYTLSTYVRTNASRKQASMRPRFLDSSKVRQTALDPTSVWVPLTANQWTRVSMTFTVPAGAAYMAPWTDADNFSDTPWVSGDTFDGTALLAVLGSTLGSYFDGDTPDAGGKTYEWEGAVNNSTSVERGNPASGPTYTIWDGNVEVAVASVTIWNGTSEVAMASTSIA